MSVGRIATIWRYPVKSMGGEELPETTVTERGVPGDRSMALLDCETGKVASAKHPRRWGMLLDCQARLVGFSVGSTTPAIQITLPDGRTLESGQEDINERFAQLLGRSVTLSSVPPPQAETEREYPDVVGLPVSGMFFAGQIGLGAPSGTFFDYAPIHLLTTASMAALRRVAPNSAVDLRRFRPNLVIATPDAEGFVENDWVGRTLLLGDGIRLRVTDPTPRCVIPTLPQGINLPRDPSLLRTIAAHNRPPIPTLGGVNWPSIGVYATVEHGGTVRDGDEVRLAGD